MKKNKQIKPVTKRHQKPIKAWMVEKNGDLKQFTNIFTTQKNGWAALSRETNMDRTVLEKNGYRVVPVEIRRRDG